MVQKDTKIYTKSDIISIRDKMSLKDLRQINDECMKRFNFVCYKFLFMTMGFEHAYNDKWHKIN